MKLLCLFRQCRWVHLFNIATQGSLYPNTGIYQCTSCKSISVGAWRAGQRQRTAQEGEQ